VHPPLIVPGSASQATWVESAALEHEALTDKPEQVETLPPAQAVTEAALEVVELKQAPVPPPAVASHEHV